MSNSYVMRKLRLPFPSGRSTGIEINLRLLWIIYANEVWNQSHWLFCSGLPESKAPPAAREACAGGPCGSLPPARPPRHPWPILNRTRVWNLFSNIIQSPLFLGLESYHARVQFALPWSESEVDKVGQLDSKYNVSLSGFLSESWLPCLCRE